MHTIRLDDDVPLVATIEPTMHWPHPPKNREINKLEPFNIKEYQTLTAETISGSLQRFVISRTTNAMRLPLKKIKT